MQDDLFSDDLQLTPHSVLFRAAVTTHASALVADVVTLLKKSPLRHFQIVGGKAMSVASSNCGRVGWVSDDKGYRYQTKDPITKKNWPAMPKHWQTLAADLALRAGYPNFTPDCCLINRYDDGAQMGLHADTDEQDFTQPIVSLSIGASAVFLWGGEARTDPTQKFMLKHGDVLVWGGDDRRRMHGINRVMITREFPYRLNLTFRQAQ